MSEYKNFVRRNLEGGCVVCEDVHLPSGNVSTFYFSPRNIYVISCGKKAPKNQRQEICALLETGNFKFYVLDGGTGVSGLYDDLSDTLRPMTEEELFEDVNNWLDNGRPTYKPYVIEGMISRLKTADIKARGYAVDDTGELFLLRHGTLKKASPCSSDLQYYLTLFGGTLGAHKFALGKFTTGCIYLLTGGLFLFGWLTDILQLFLGATKDSKNRYVFPLKNRVFKLLLLPLGFAAGIALFLCYLKCLDLFGFGVQEMAEATSKSIDPYAFQRLLDFVNDSISQ